MFSGNGRWTKANHFSLTTTTMRVSTTAIRSGIGRWTKANHFILTTTSMQVGSTIVTSALGFFYWLIATRLFLPEAVGVAAASISAMQLLATFSVLGLGTLLISELPRRQHEQGSLIKVGLTTAAISGCLIGGIGGLVLFTLVPEWRGAGLHVVMIALFVVGVSLSSVSLVLDQVVIGLTISSVQLGRNTVFAIVKLIAIVMAALFLFPKVAETIFATWVIGIVTSLVVILCLPVWKRYRGRRSKIPAWQLLRGLARSSMEHHVLNLALAAPSMAMPTVALIALGAASAAYFYSALTLANFAYMIPFALSISLFAAGSGSSGAPLTRARTTLGLSFSVAVLANVVLLLGAHTILAIFGKAYSQNAAIGLQVLGLAVFPLIVKDHFIALQRIRRHVGKTVLVAAFGCLLELSLAIFGAMKGGLVGLCIGWLIALGIEAIYMGVPLLKLLLAPSSSSTELASS